MRVTKRVEGYIREKITDVVCKPTAEAAHIEELCMSVQERVTRECTEFREKLLADIAEEYPELKECTVNYLGMYTPRNHPSVMKSNALLGRACNLANKAVEDIIISLELRTPANALDGMIENACANIQKALEEVSD